MDFLELKDPMLFYVKCLKNAHKCHFWVFENDENYPKRDFCSGSKDLVLLFRNPPDEEYFVPVEVENQPRNVAQMKDFGNRLGDFEDTDEPVMDLNNLEQQQSSIRTSFLRQSDAGEETTESTAPGAEDDDDAIRCIPKVMQVSDLPNITYACKSLLIAPSEGKTLYNCQKRLSQNLHP